MSSSQMNWQESQYASWSRAEKIVPVSSSIGTTTEFRNLEVTSAEEKGTFFSSAPLSYLGGGVQAIGLVLRRTQIRSFPSSKEADKCHLVVNMILRDAKDSIVLSCWGDSTAILSEPMTEQTTAKMAEQTTIQVGDVIKLTNPQVKEAKKNYGSTSSPLELRIDNRLQISKIMGKEAEDWLKMIPHAIPVPLPNRKEYSLVEAKKCPVGQIISVRGVVSSLSHLITRPRKIPSSSSLSSSSSSLSSSSSSSLSSSSSQKSITKFQKIGLVEPNSGSEVVVTLWGNGVELLRGIAPGRSVVLLNGVKVTSFQDSIGLSFTDYSLLWLDPPRLRWLRDWMEATQPTIETFFPIIASPASGSGGELGSCCSLADLDTMIDDVSSGQQEKQRFDHRFGGDEGIDPERVDDKKTSKVLTFFAMMAEIRLDERAVYLACPNCRHKIEEGGGNDCCQQESCRQGFEGIFQWKLPVTFIDHSAKMMMTMFGHLPDELLGISAAEFASHLGLKRGEVPSFERHWIDGLRNKVLWQRWHCNLRHVGSSYTLTSISPPYYHQFLEYLKQI